MSKEKRSARNSSRTRLRDWTDVRDLSRLLARIAEQPQQDAFRVINGGSGCGTTVAEIVQMLVRHWGGAVAVRYSGIVRAGDPFSLVADAAGLHRLPFDWRVPIEHGLIDYVKWFKGELS